ncbi:MAG: 30S ribosomal protein S9 [Parcubacteria group bacterium CG11_big_fil_rev_8_21_14_0_20_39_22]|nr:MAG: 30S ribosomal protein S9 [Parcubacteria group bacterium CG11_big_fil_rev_8_21_14_0_20_39_22]
MNTTTKEDLYIEAVGRRKTSVARVRLTPASKRSFIINDKDLNDYFQTSELIRIATEGLNCADSDKTFKVTAKIFGGGIHGQAEALRHAIARAIVKDNEELRKKVKKLGFLKRDPRAKERRKFGLKKARKAPQWSKR